MWESLYACHCWCLLCTSTWCDGILCCVTRAPVHRTIYQSLTFLDFVLPHLAFVGIVLERKLTVCLPLGEWTLAYLLIQPWSHHPSLYLFFILASYWIGDNIRQTMLATQQRVQGLSSMQEEVIIVVQISIPALLKHFVKPLISASHHSVQFRKSTYCVSATFPTKISLHYGQGPVGREWN